MAKRKATKQAVPRVLPKKKPIKKVKKKKKAVKKVNKKKKVGLSATRSGKSYELTGNQHLLSHAIFKATEAQGTYDGDIRKVCHILATHQIKSLDDLEDACKLYVAALARRRGRLGDES